MGNVDGVLGMDETKLVLLEEWKEVRESLRYFGNKRFAQLTVYIATTGFLVGAHFGQTDLKLRLLLGIVGLLVAAHLPNAKFMYESSAVEYQRNDASRKPFQFS